MSPEPQPPADDLPAKRAALTRARQAVQARLFLLAGGGLLLRGLASEEPWPIVVYLVGGAGLALRWVRGYRRLKAELGLAREYDELDENAAWSGKLVVIVVGMIGVFFLFWFGLLWATRKH